VFEFLGNVNRLQDTALPHSPPEASPDQGAVTYVRPHDIELSRESGPDTIAVVVHHVFAAGPWARVQVVGNHTGEWFDAELSREVLDVLQPKYGQLMYARMRKARVFAPNATTAKPVEPTKFDK
jgi:sulfate transport system ATP-binding protein